MRVDPTIALRHELFRVVQAANLDCCRSTHSCRSGSRHRAEVSPIAKICAKIQRKPFVRTQRGTAQRPQMNRDSSLAALVDAVERGDTAASRILFATLYDELHRLAKRQLNRHAYALTLNTTTLLHEAYIEMAAKDEAAFPDRSE